MGLEEGRCIGCSEMTGLWHQKGEGSESLPCLQVNKLACYHFVDAGRKHKTPGSEKKDFITRGATGCISSIFPLVSHVPQFPQDYTGGYR